MYLIRNQAYRKVPWVRIPPSPPKEKTPCKSMTYMGFSLVAIANDFQNILIIHCSDIRLRHETARFKKTLTPLCSLGTCNYFCNCKFASAGGYDDFSLAEHLTQLNWY